LLFTFLTQWLEREAGPAAAAMPNIWTGGWLRGLSPMGVVWAIDSFAPYKSPGMDGIFPALLQEGWGVLVPSLFMIFHACLVTGYIFSHIVPG